MAVQHFFSSSGEWIAFRRNPTDRYLFDTQGNWVGWFPWGDNDVVDINGQYLGTVTNGNRLYQNAFKPYRGYPGYPGYPGYAGYPGYPGYAGYSFPPLGAQDVTFKRR